MYSKTTVVGRLVADPIVKNYIGKNGQQEMLANFRIAANLGGEQTAFYNATAFRGTASAMSKYLKKGSKLLVEGQFVNNNYQKVVDGVTVDMFTLNLIAQRVVFLDDAPRTTGANTAFTEQQVVAPAPAPVAPPVAPTPVMAQTPVMTQAPVAPEPIAPMQPTQSEMAEFEQFMAQHGLI